MKNLKNINPLASLGDDLVLFNFGEEVTEDPDFKCHFAHLINSTITIQDYHRMLKFGPYNEVTTEDEKEYFRQLIYCKIPNEILIEIFLNEE